MLFHYRLYITLLGLSLGMLACSSSRNAGGEEEGQKGEKGSLRWRVKTLTDLDTNYVRFDRVIQSSIKEQSRLLTRPVSSSTPRLASETQVYAITALLTSIKRE